MYLHSCSSPYRSDLPSNARGRTAPFTQPTFLSIFCTMSVTVPLAVAAPAYAPPLPTAHPPLPRPTLQLARPGEKRRRISRRRVEEMPEMATAAAGTQDRSRLADSVDSVQDLDGLLLPWASEDSADPATSSHERDALLPMCRDAEDSRARLHRRGEGDSDFGPGDYGWGQSSSD